MVVGRIIGAVDLGEVDREGEGEEGDREVVAVVVEDRRRRYLRSEMVVLTKGWDGKLVFWSWSERWGVSATSVVRSIPPPEVQ